MSLEIWGEKDINLPDSRWRRENLWEDPGLWSPGDFEKEFVMPFFSRLQGSFYAQTNAKKMLGIVMKQNLTGFVWRIQKLMVNKRWRQIDQNKKLSKWLMQSIPNNSHLMIQENITIFLRVDW